MTMDVLNSNSTTLQMILIALIVMVGGVLAYTCTSLAVNVQNDVAARMQLQNTVITQRTDNQLEIMIEQERAIDSLDKSVARLNDSVDQLLKTEQYGKRDRANITGAYVKNALT